MPVRICVAILGLALSSSIARAQDKCQWTSWQEFARAVSESSPEIKRLKAESDFETTKIQVARLSPDSLVNAQFTAGEFPWKASTFEGTYLWTLENGAKKAAREAAVRAAVGRVESELDDQKAQQLLRIALTQQVLKRLESRREILLETKETYSKLIQRYKRIPSRGPEQETSLAVIEIAKGETDLRLHALDVEESEKLYDLASLSGCSSISLPIKALAKLKTPSWIDGEVPEDSTRLRRLEAEALAIGALQDADIKSFASDLSIGPVLIAGRDEDRSRFEVGVAASFALSDGRSRELSLVRTSEAKVQQARIELEKTQLRIGREAWKSQYHRATNAMKTGLTNEEIARRHQKFEALFRSERISAALVIESHRQMLEHVVAYSELEAKAAEALWNLRYLDGKLNWRDL